MMFHAAHALRHADPSVAALVSHARLALAETARLAARHSLQVRAAAAVLDGGAAIGVCHTFAGP